MIRPVDVTLARAKCPRCGFVVVAASVAARKALCIAHDAEVHSLTPSDAGAPEPCPSAASKAAIAPAVQPC
jgi:uncharacterized protein (UPF0212 family)